MSTFSKQALALSLVGILSCGGASTLPSYAAAEDVNYSAEDIAKREARIRELEARVKAAEQEAYIRELEEREAQAKASSNAQRRSSARATPIQVEEETVAPKSRVQTKVESKVDRKTNETANKVENKVDQKIDRTIDSVTDKIFSGW